MLIAMNEIKHLKQMSEMGPAGDAESTTSALFIAAKSKLAEFANSKYFIAKILVNDLRSTISFEE